ncbi:hypothetical protein MFLAVUS_010094 [Mucor flavus]|uniref:EF-hand domain-containing protein n=1 Tax=Mucor flavus TaxID=439312 RepID=A0ABP9ZBZ7_9FUNG
MSDRLTQEQITEYREAFQLFDRNGDGSISASELGVVLRSFGMNPSDAELQDMVNGVDADNNGHIDFEEFLNLVKTLTPDRDTDDLKEAFNAFDVDGNGVIDRSELHKVISSLNETLTEQELDAMIQEADIDEDGTTMEETGASAAIVAYITNESKLEYCARFGSTKDEVINAPESVFNSTTFWIRELQEICLI